MSSKQYTIHDYDHRYDAGLAQMWNESDDQWPGTFTDGVPLTEERVREWMDRIQAIKRFIVIEDQTGKVVGYGDLWDTAVRPNSCYVALLNVHPAHQGRSLARRMLVNMVEWAVANSYDRITIGTWPANLKAMPLYKKVGFFWKPDTSVYMENYLPAARLLPAAKPFFERHDWYRTYDRDLSQVEDGSAHPCTGNMKVYTLRWQEDGESLEVVFDRNAQALTGIETHKWAAFARTSEPEPGKSIRYPFEWEFYNKTDQPLHIKVHAGADEGIELLYSSEFDLQPRSGHLLRKTFRVTPDAPKYQGYHEDVPTPRVRTYVQLNGTELEFGTGLRYKQALDISVFPEAVSLTPGVPQPVHLQVRNETRQALEGALELELPEGLQADWVQQAFHLPAEGFSGLPVTLTAEKAGFYPLRVCPETTASGKLTAKLLPVTALAPGGWTAGAGDEELVLENDFFRINAKARAGEAIIFNKDTLEEDARLMEEIGPAYVPWDLHEQEYDLNLQVTGSEARAIMTVRSTRFPGVVVGRELAINGSPLIRLRGWITNNSDQVFEALHLRPHMSVSCADGREIAVPFREGVVLEHASQFGATEEDLPKDFNRYAEPWLAYQEHGRVLGMIWSEGRMADVIHENGRHYMFFATPLKPGETRHIPPLYFYSGPGDWRAVQQAHRRLTGKTAERTPIGLAATARSHLQVLLAPDPLVTLDDRVDAQLRLETTRQYRLAGSVNLRLPDGWSVDFAAMPFEIDREHPFETPVRFIGDTTAALGVHAGELVFDSQSFTRRQPFRIFRLGDSGKRVEISVEKDDHGALYRIENGHSRWTVAPDFHGGVIAWQTAGSETNQLLTSYPDEGEWSWMKPFLGGVRPVLFDVVRDSGWPGKLQRETFTAAAVDLSDSHGLAWSGVRLKTEVQADWFKGMRIELDYLTLAGSNLLKMAYRVVNTSPVYRKAQIGWFTFVQPDGTHANAALHTDVYSRKRTPHSSWGFHEGWTAIENPATGRTLAFLPASGLRRIQALDLGVFGAHAYMRETVDIRPDETLELEAYLALTDSVEQAKQYAGLIRKRGRI